MAVCSAQLFAGVGGMDGDGFPLWFSQYTNTTKLLGIEFRNLSIVIFTLYKYTSLIDFYIEGGGGARRFDQYFCMDSVCLCSVCTVFFSRHLIC